MEDRPEELQDGGRSRERRGGPRRWGDGGCRRRHGASCLPPPAARILDNLPIGMVRLREDKGQQVKSYERGYPVGFQDVSGRPAPRPLAARGGSWQLGAGDDAVGSGPCLEQRPVHAA